MKTALFWLILSMLLLALGLYDITFGDTNLTKGIGIFLVTVNVFNITVWSNILKERIK